MRKSNIKMQKSKIENCFQFLFLVCVFDL